MTRIQNLKDSFYNQNFKKIFEILIDDFSECLKNIQIRQTLDSDGFSLRAEVLSRMSNIGGVSFPSQYDDGMGGDTEEIVDELIDYLKDALNKLKNNVSEIKDEDKKLIKLILEAVMEEAKTYASDRQEAEIFFVELKKK